ncbi:MAG: hypothetical protein EXR94_06070 [Gemmatimonadetes bacterium]|nr:hypothetical protein [Gemmatimonadota bacterium]
MNHRIGSALATLVVGVSGGVMAQNPTTVPSGSTGAISSRFIPPELMSRMMERPSELPSSVTVAAGRDAAWLALTEVFKSFDIPMSYSDQAAGEVGTIKAKMMRRLGKQPLSQYLRCGEGLTGPNADSYVVYFSIAGFVKAAANNEVTVATLVTAHAIDLPNGRNDVMFCTTSGRLEEKIAKAVQLRLAVKP